MSAPTRTVRIGTRASLLARTQTDLVAQALRSAGVEVEVVHVSTEGDRSQAAGTPIPDTGVGVFVGALREALAAGTVDVAVHSYKDLPTAPPAGLVLAAVTAREDPRDVLVARDRMVLGELPPGAVVGTGSPRRAVQLAALGLGLEVVPIRGNVETRIGMVTRGELDAVVLARAGLARLGRLGEATEVLDPLQMLPAPAQGALACECRVADVDVERLVHDALHDTATATAVAAERAVLATLEAGCSAPVGALADIVSDLEDDGSIVDRLSLRAVAATAEGALVRASATGGDQGRGADRAGAGRRAARRRGTRAPRGQPGRGRGRAVRPVTSGDDENGMGPTDMTAAPAGQDRSTTGGQSTTAGRVAFVGSGPGDPGLLTVRAHEALATATVVVVDPAVPAAVVGLAAGGPVPAVVEVGGPPTDAADAAASVDAGDPAAPVVVDGTDPTALGDDPEALAVRLVERARDGASVVRLVAGDPLTSDRVVTEVRAVAASGVPFDVVPGMPVATAVPAYAGVALGAAHTSADVRVAGVDVGALAAAPGPLVLQADPGDLGATASALVENGWKPETEAVVTASGTGSRQRTVATTLGALAGDAAELEGPLVVTVGDVAGPARALPWWESRALYGWRVLVPRTKDQAGAMSDRLRVHGAVPEEVPTIAVEPPRSPAQMERAVKGLVDGRYQWVVFTSANAVRAVWEKFAEFGLDARAFSGVRIACVGEATASVMRGFGVQPELVPAEQTEQSSEGLLDIFPPHDDVLDPVDRVLLPRADIATETLAEGLQARGWEIDDVTAYRTVRAAPPPATTREAIKTGGFDAVCFTSSSTVRNLVGIAGKPHARTIVACIGPKTAETAVEFGLRVDVRPDVAEVPALVEALAAHAARLRAEDALPPPRKTKARKR